MKELQNGNIVKIKFIMPFVKEENISCTIKWVENDRIGLVFPQDRMDIIRDLPEGREIEAVIYSDSGIFAFDSIVINSPLEHDFVIELPVEKKKIQRREYVRAPISLRLTLKKGDVNFETRTINIGGGGIRFFADEEFKAEDRWVFSLFLPDGMVIKGIGRVLYTLLQGRNVASVILFTDISETERNRIIKLCFDEEIKYLKAKKIS
ncbi:MAG: hypothetical protein A2Y25_10730 [Candidatus Melainabacteria bacterium GWF2_37_15]|nr:MAG: hypothetical protein A2Y25_10730 [Candidatus Melainabacteria bacterium GWF2_37_15]